MKITDKKIIFSGLFAMIAILCLAANVSFADSPGGVCVNHTLIGYAWSENIGAISFSCKNLSTGTDYGVDIDPSTGILSGHAWNSASSSYPGVGYISFNRAETNVPPSNDICTDGTCIAKLDGTKIKGWARAISACNWDGTKCTDSGAGSKAGNWDGWIRLDCSDCTTPYNLAVTSTPIASGPNAGKYPLEGWAWSGGNGGTALEKGKTSVIGSIEFKGSNFGVVSAVGPKHNPTAVFSCNNSACHTVPPADACTCYTDSNLNFINESTDSGNDINKSLWKVDGTTYGDCTVYAKSNCQMSGSGLLGSHNIMLTVTDSNGDMSSTTRPVTFLSGAVANFSCSASGQAGDWYSNCLSITPKPDQDSVIWLSSSSSVPSAGGSITSKAWTYLVNGVANPSSIFTVVDSNTVTTTLDKLPASIKLEVWDNKGGYDKKTQNLSAIPIPVWIELSPFKGL
jgi:hypothetical protein